MLDFVKTKVSQKTGLPPGSLVYVGDKKFEKARVTKIEFNESFFNEQDLLDIQQCKTSKQEGVITWINVDGLHHEAIVQTIGHYYNIHPLALEDILNTEQRVKIEIHQEYLYIIVKNFFYDKEIKHLRDNQISIIIGEGYLLTFQENASQIFSPIVNRIRMNKGIVRKSTVDYLAYTLIDSVVDDYFFILEQLGEKIELLEEMVLREVSRDRLFDIHGVKKNLLYLRKTTWPLREVLNSLLRGDSKFIHPNTIIYIQDAYDHAIEIIETIEILRDMITVTMDIYLTGTNNRMNAVMKVLTVIGTIFIPLTFITGIYGMNFEYMPELKSIWGYPVILFVMFVIGLGMVVYFKIKNWF